MRRLHPIPADAVPAFAACVDPNRHRHPDGLPWVEVCMVASVDGATAVEGRSGGLSSTADGELLQALRALADVVLVGAATVRAEGYGVPRKAGLRVGVVSSRGEGLDFDSALFTSGAGFVVTTETAPDLPVDTVRAGTDELDLRRALAQLDVGFVHAEGGPRLNGALLAAGLVDEINVTIAPLLAGGDAHRLTFGAPAAATGLRLAHVLEEDGFLFCRYLRT